MYVDSLIGPDTINTMLLKTLTAYRDHGDPAPRLEEGVEESQEIFVELSGLGIDLEDVARQLEVQGEQSFIQSFDLLMKTIKSRRSDVHRERQTVGSRSIEGFSRQRGTR